jgi:uncharacterized phiE125 gp8 family phage protein
MIIKQTAAPAVEPVTVAEAKAHMRVDISDDDDYITALIVAAREYIEGATRRALITQTWRYSLDGWPDGDEIVLPKPPLQSVTSIVYKDEDGTANTWSSSGYIVDTDSDPGRVVLAYGESWPSVTLYPAAPIQITYKAGYGDAAANVPGHLRHAIKFLVAHWYENREPVTVGQVARDVPLAVDSLIWLYRAF